VPCTNPRTQWRFGRFRRLSRRSVTRAAAVLLAVTAVIVPASTATATTSDAECLGTFTRNFFSRGHPHTADCHRDRNQ